MTNERYDDEALSAIIDDDADAELVASVAADADAADRLELMRRAVNLVAEPVPDATPERRAASIAAAMAAASPAPEVSSLAAARHERTARAEAKKRSMPRAWIGIAAAMIMFVIAIPIAFSLGSGNDSADTATDTASLSVDDAASDSDTAGFAEDAADDAVDAVDDAVDDAMSDDAGDSSADAEEPSSVISNDSDEDAMDDEAMDDDEPAESADGEDTVTATTTFSRDLDLNNPQSFFTVNNLDVLNDFIQLGDTISPQLSSGEVIGAGVNPDCVRPTSEITNPTPYDLVNLDHFGGSSEVVLIEFADDGGTRVLNAEDCARLG